MMPLTYVAGESSRSQQLSALGAARLEKLQDRQSPVVIGSCRGRYILAGGQQQLRPLTVNQ